MKTKYKDLKLIIQCPTEEAGSAVVDFFGINSLHENWWRAAYGQNTLLCINDLTTSGRSTYGDRLEDWSEFNYEYLTYPEFENRFLKPMENKTIDLNGLDEDEIAVIEFSVNRLRERHKDKAVPTEPEKWTVEGNDIPLCTSLK